MTPGVLDNPFVTAVARAARRHPLWTILIVALAVRCLNIWFLAETVGSFYVEDDFFPVISSYWARAFGFLPNAPVNLAYAERVPLYPLLVALLQGLGLGAPALLALANALIDAVTCTIIGRLGCMIGRPTGTAAGLLAACWPNLIIHSGLVLSDTLFVLIFTGLLWCAGRTLQRPAMVKVAAAGGLLGLAIVTRPVAQFLPIPIFFAVVAIALYHRWSALRAAAAAALFLLATLIAPLPVLIHNHIKFDALTLSNQGGTHLLFWVVPAVKQAEDGTPKHETRLRLQQRKAEIRTLIGEGPSAQAYSRENRLMTALALSELAASSPAAIAVAWAKGMALNLATPAVLIDQRVRAFARQSFYDLNAKNFYEKVTRYLQGNGPVYTTVFALGSLGSIATSLLALYGLMRLWRLSRWAALFAVLAILYFLLVNGPVASPKYRLPLEPILVVLTTLGAGGIWSWLKARYRHDHC
jgi:4-amino-4-deoxy-L-arabinose transferase-like glycosyltransferase